MAWTESYHCDVCNSPRGDAEDWWLAFIDHSTEPAAASAAAAQDALRITRWSQSLSHSPEVKHLCGARCAQTFMDRWMRGEDER